MSENDFIARHHPTLAELWDLMWLHSQKGPAPFDCSDLNDQVTAMLTCAANISLYFNEQAMRERTSQNRLYLTEMSLAGATRALTNVHYEQSKVR